MDKKQKIFFILNISFLLLTILTDVLYIKLGNPYVFKTLASATFVVWSLVNLAFIFSFKIIKNLPFSVSMLVGQIFACIGDIVLIDHFILGAIFFAIGHVFFLISYMFVQKFKLQDLIYIFSTIIISICVILISKINFGSNLPLIIAYAIVISAMLGKSITLFRGNKTFATTAFIGSLMFFLSDLFLMFTVFGTLGHIGNVLCLAFYYPAEFVLASTIGVNALTNKN